MKKTIASLFVVIFLFANTAHAQVTPATTESLRASILAQIQALTQIVIQLQAMLAEALRQEGGVTPSGSGSPIATSTIETNTEVVVCDAQPEIVLPTMAQMTGVSPSYQPYFDINPTLYSVCPNQRWLIDYKAPKGETSESNRFNVPMIGNGGGSLIDSGPRKGQYAYILDSYTNHFRFSTSTKGTYSTSLYFHSPDTSKNVNLPLKFDLPQCDIYGCDNELRYLRAHYQLCIDNLSTIGIPIEFVYGRCVEWSKKIDHFNQFGF